MLDGYITEQTHVTLTFGMYEKIIACARDLELPYDEVLRAVVNTAVRRHFERFETSSDEVSSDD